LPTIAWPSDDDLLTLISEHGSMAGAARAIGVSPSTLKDHVRRRGITVDTRQPVERSEEPTREEVLESELKELRRRVGKQRSVDVQAERVLQAIEDTIRPVEPIYRAPEPSEPGGKKHVQALVLSDLHCGEVVVPEAVNGLNEFNWDVLVRRMASIEKSLLSFQQARPYPVDELHIWLLGDNLSGNIHEELAETNEFPVAEQAWRVGSLIAQFIERLVPHFPKIVVEGVAGNHPRIGKPHSSKQVFDSFDWLAYKIIETHLANYESVSCNFPQAAFIVAEIAGLRILLWHGDGVRSSMPGVPWGGVMRRWNELRKQYAQQGTHLDGLALGHFHTANVVQGSIFMNGSVCGLNEYGLKNFGSGEKPTQLLLTFQPDKKRLTDVSYINPR
jgi:transposase-like protein